MYDENTSQSNGKTKYDIFILFTAILKIINIHNILQCFKY